MFLSLDKIKHPVAGELDKFEGYFRASVKTKIPLLNIITNYIIRRKGKRIRPMFVFLTAKLNGSISSSTYTAASLIELLHTATLIHDDVVDESFERRGFFSINALWKSKIAVLVGDYLLAKGLLLAIDNKEYELLNIVSEAVKEMSEGELLQIQKSRTLNITMDEYFEVIRKKTATLIAACTACGAKSVNANDEDIAKLKEFGEYAGISFQIKDDLLDYEKSGLTGKPSGNDIKEKKLTLPLIYALEKSSTSEKRKIKSLIRNHNNNSQKVKEVINFVIQNKGLEFSTQIMNEYKDKAQDILKTFPDNDAKTALKQLLEFTTNRRK